MPLFWVVNHYKNILFIYSSKLHMQRASRWLHGNPFESSSYPSLHCNSNVCVSIIIDEVPIKKSMHTLAYYVKEKNMTK